MQASFKQTAVLQNILEDRLRASAQCDATRGGGGQSPNGGHQIIRVAERPVNGERVASGGRQLDDETVVVAAIHSSSRQARGKETVPPARLGQTVMGCYGVGRAQPRGVCGAHAQPPPLAAAPAASRPLSCHVSRSLSHRPLRRAAGHCRSRRRRARRTPRSGRRTRPPSQCQVSHRGTLRAARARAGGPAACARWRAR